MDLYPLDDEVERLEAELAAARAGRPALTVLGLAWALRQRDSPRALQLADEAERLDRAAAQPYPDLIRAEVAALRSDYPRAEEALARALEACKERGVARITGDAAMVEAVVAHAQAQRERYLAAWRRAGESYARGGDGRRRHLARAWLAFLGTHTDRAQAATEVAALRAEVAKPRHPALEALLHAADGMLGFATAGPASAVSAHTASLYARECGMVRHAIVSAVNAGTAMQSLADYEGAAQCYDWAVNAARKTGWPALIGSTVMRLGSLHRELNQLESSEQLFREALRGFEHAPGGFWKAEAHAGLGNTLLRQGRAREAVELLLTAVDLFRAEAGMDGLTVNLTILARAQAHCGEAEAAQATLAEAAALIEKLGVTRLRVDLHEARAELHECGVVPPPAGLTSKEAAAHCLEESLAAGRAIEGWQPSSRLLLHLGRAWSEAGDAKRAFAYAEQAFQTQQRENLRKATNAAGVMRAQHDIDRARAEVAHQRSLIAALEQASLTDALTGLRNRRFLQQHLEADVAQLLRRYQAGRPQALPDADLVFFLVDIDHFKQVNDTHGHAVGDAVLVQMKARLAEVFRDSDYLVRWGGEEFLVVARGCSRAAAPQFAERMRAVMAARPFAIDESLELAKTCSIGFAAMPFFPAHAAVVSWQEVVDIADAALYLAKRNGRNGWVGLGPAEGAAPAGYARRVKLDPLPMLRAGELAVQTSIAALQFAPAVKA